MTAVVLIQSKTIDTAVGWEILSTLEGSAYGGVAPNSSTLFVVLVGQQKAFPLLSARKDKMASRCLLATKFSYDEATFALASVLFSDIFCPLNLCSGYIRTCVSHVCL
jgi:hypothetical protein